MIMNIKKFFCEDCKLVFTQDIKEYIEFADKVKEYTNTNDLFSYITNINCPFCKSSEYTFLVDDNMASIIKTIYDKGYTTYACCEGHGISEIGYFHSLTMPYIAFNTDYDLLKWIADKNNSYLVNKFDIEIKPSSIIFRPHSERYIDPEEYHLEFELWKLEVINLFTELAKSLITKDPIQTISIDSDKNIN